MSLVLSLAITTSASSPAKTCGNSSPVLSKPLDFGRGVVFYSRIANEVLMIKGQDTLVLVTDPVADAIRVTKDADVIVDVNVSYAPVDPEVTKDVDVIVDVNQPLPTPSHATVITVI